MDASVRRAASASGGVTFDREHHPGKPRQDRRLVTGAGANLEHAVVRLRRQRFGHDRNHVGLRDGLSFSDCERMVFVGLVPQRLGHEEMPRHGAAHRALVADADDPRDHAARGRSHSVRLPTMALSRAVRKRPRPSCPSSRRSPI